MPRHGDHTPHTRSTERTQEDAFRSQGEYGSGGSYGVGGGFDDPEERRSLRVSEEQIPYQQPGWQLGPPAQSVQGPFYGVAPRGYQRSDERVREDVCELLMVQGHIDPSRVSVRVERGEVILEGEVDSRRDKLALEAQIEHVLGVTDVDNRLRIARSS